jgi:hypothetical protein
VSALVRLLRPTVDMMCVWRLLGKLARRGGALSDDGQQFVLLGRVVGRAFAEARAPQATAGVLTSLTARAASPGVRILMKVNGELVEAVEATEAAARCEALKWDGGWRGWGVLVRAGWRRLFFS